MARSHLTEEKIATMPENMGNVAIFVVVMKYSNLFLPFTFFLNSFHMPFSNKFKVGIKTTDSMQSIGQLVAYVK